MSGGWLHLFHPSSERSICPDLDAGSSILSFVYVARLSLSLHFESSMVFSLLVFFFLSLDHSAALTVALVTEEEEVSGGHSF